MLVEVDPNAWLQVFGRFHIVLLHLPIGLIPGIKPIGRCSRTI